MILDSVLDIQDFSRGKDPAKLREKLDTPRGGEWCRGAISSGGGCSLVEGSSLRWRRAIAGGG